VSIPKILFASSKISKWGMGKRAKGKRGTGEWEKRGRGILA
jgi:hypothetical protein